MASRQSAQKKQEQWARFVAAGHANLQDPANAGSGNSGKALSRLVNMCLDVASASWESLHRWRHQKRTLERMPAHLSEALLHRLLLAGLLTPPLLELFQESIEELYISGVTLVDAEWTAYIANFRCLWVLHASDCRFLSNFALSHLKGMNTLSELNISCCARVTDEGSVYIASLSNLKKLAIAETGVTDMGVKALASLTSLVSLDLGGLPITDSGFFSLLVLQQLQHVVLWGCRLTDEGAMNLGNFKHLKHLNLEWTSVNRVPPLPLLKYLNMSNCKVLSIFYGWNMLDAPLSELHLSGADFEDSSVVLTGKWMRNLKMMNLSFSNFTSFEVLSETRSLEVLDLAGALTPEPAMQPIANIGHSLTQLNLSNLKVTSAGLGILTGHLPKLEHILLSGTLVDDNVFSVLGSMPALKSIDLSDTAIKGLEGEKGSKFSSFLAIQGLQSLRMLNLQNTPMSDTGCCGLQILTGLTHLFLRCESLSDSCLETISLLGKLLIVGVEGCMLTDMGLQNFKLSSQLKELVLFDCWLLTEKGLLQFCELHTQLHVSHGLLSNSQTFFKGKVTKYMKTSPMSSKLRRISKTTSTWNSQLGDDADERIKYTRIDLLDLRHLSDNQHLKAADFPAVLLVSEKNF